MVDGLAILSQRDTRICIKNRQLRTHLHNLMSTEELLKDRLVDPLKKENL